MSAKSKIKKNKSSLRSVMLSFFVILFFVYIILIYYTTLLSETQEKITKIGEVNAVTSAEQIDQYLSDGVVTMNFACYTLDSMIRNGKSQDEIREFLVEQTKAVKEISLANSTGLYGFFNGEYLDGSEWVPASNYNPLERPWYIAAKGNIGRVAVVDPYIDAQTNTVMITFSKTLCDAKSVAAMDFSMDHVQEITEEIATHEESEMEMILDTKYKVVAHSDRSEIGENYLEEKDTFGNALVEQMKNTEDNNFEMQYNGFDYIIYKVPVSNDWTCVSVFNATNEYNKLKNLLTFTIFAVLLVVFILFFIFFLLNIEHEQFTQLGVHAVEAIASAIDAKDAYTKGHSDRVAQYAREIGKRHGYSGSQQDEIHMLGLLHDVGKIGIPDAVINKPGKLNDEEFEMIKDHPTIGAKILSKTPELAKLAMGARYHHERYDGTGYPEGLVGNEIPEEARIIAVADAYDAMTSRRSYRDALPIDVVKKEIEKGKGTQFDPVFADIMLDMIDDDERDNGVIDMKPDIEDMP